MMRLELNTLFARISTQMGTVVDWKPNCRLYVSGELGDLAELGRCAMAFACCCQQQKADACSTGGLKQSLDTLSMITALLAGVLHAAIASAAVEFRHRLKKKDHPSRAKVYCVGGQTVAEGCLYVTSRGLARKRAKC